MGWKTAHTFNPSKESGSLWVGPYCPHSESRTTSATQWDPVPLKRWLLGLQDELAAGSVRREPACCFSPNALRGSSRVTRQQLLRDLVHKHTPGCSSGTSDSASEVWTKEFPFVTKAQSVATDWESVGAECSISRETTALCGQAELLSSSWTDYPQVLTWRIPKPIVRWKD